MNTIQKIQREQSANVTQHKFRIGDVIRVHVRIKEGDKERIQQFTGTVIARRRGESGGSFTVRRVSHGVGVERIFPMASPFISKIEIESSSTVRRSKLYYLRRLTGKRARLKTAAMEA
ncbi:MAG: 50S ribosomal protein L19 [Lentisphaerae bacterium RIFOXYC12_FULL_60_16]|nr:MAG: 50S ribosomal protein L19 [Lentisphaerae bacterium RIFOXYC12_FULL_60_16]OGV74179.1 MAG: 50S ribosomal protein L19 [Lentisphaerae bacterium RIFOXYA12_FULL_60_10]OGV74830.1 MAG: 50S ribosomal protein L19 [Lentisphaerae bacterium RIFOXYB12_FULL_60_10]